MRWKNQIETGVSNLTSILSCEERRGKKAKLSNTFSFKEKAVMRWKNQIETGVSNLTSILSCEERKEKESEAF